MAIQAQLCTDNIGFTLCGSQDWMDNGYGCVNSGFNQFCFNLEQQQQQQQPQQQLQHMQQLQNQQQQRNQSMCFDNSLLVVPTSENYNHQSMVYPLIAQAEKQRQEIDHYIRSQNDRLRLLLQEQKKQQLALLLKNIESRTSIMLRQKDEEIAQATKRAMELENFMKRLEMENQTWKRVAQEGEAMVITLNKTVEQLRERAACYVNNDAEDAESCCDVKREEEIQGTEKNRGNRGFCDNNGEEERLVMVCKGCNSQNVCVLFLPCRHLCSCKACEAFFDSCPICGMAKNASIEALIF